MSTQQDSQAWSVFTTDIGSFGVIWRGQSICALQLDEGGVAATAEQIVRRYPDAMHRKPRGPIADLVERIRRVFQGNVDDLSDVAIDWTGVPDFARRVYASVRMIPPGQVRSYGSVAQAIGSPGAARAVGTALGRNPLPILVPCHRVVSSSGQLGGFTAKDGLQLKRRMLAAEGVAADRLQSVVQNAGSAARRQLSLPIKA